MKNWAGNYSYRAAQAITPQSVPHVQELVAQHDRVRALGSRHSFTDVADTSGALLLLDQLPAQISVNASTASVTVSAGVRYAELARELHRQGWALEAMASLPHISVAGAIATGTHGSGDRTGTLSSAVCAVELVGPDGQLRTLTRADADFAAQL